MLDARYYDMINGAPVRVLLLPMSQADIRGVCEASGIAGLSLRGAWTAGTDGARQELGELFIPWVSVRYVQVVGPDDEGGVS